MADDFTELILEGASAGINHYEKVVDPFKKHAKKIISGRSRRRNERYRSSSDESDYEDDRPRRSYSDRYTPSSRSDRRSGGGGPVRIVEEYERKRGRTLSTGGDPYSGRKPDPQCKTESSLFFFFSSFFFMLSVVLPQLWLLTSDCRRSQQGPIRLRIGIFPLPFAASSSSEHAEHKRSHSGRSSWCSRRRSTRPRLTTRTSSPIASK